MDKTIAEKLAGSLTAETTDLLPYLPYLLQDFWELGSDPTTMVELIEKYITTSENTTVLDLACGKGAVSVVVAEKLRVKVKGVDLILEFIDFAVQKANEHGVADLCSFEVGDINATAETARDYDVVIMGAAGDALGSPAETLQKLKQTVKTGGYIMIDEAYLKDGGSQEDVAYNNYEYLTEAQWLKLFEESGLELEETFSVSEDESESMDADTEMAAIIQRANELIEKHPDKKAMFEGYIRSQQSEYSDLDNQLVGVVWMLRKKGSLAD